jgi:hypothetical protein
LPRMVRTTACNFFDLGLAVALAECLIHDRAHEVDWSDRSLTDMRTVIHSSLIQAV